MPLQGELGPDRKSVLELLDFEIDRIRRSARASGWTQWALLAAAGGIAWSLLDFITQRGFGFASFAQYAVGLICAREAVTAYARILDSSPEPAAGSPKFHWSSTVLGGQELGLALQIGQAMATVALAVAVRASIPTIGTVTATAYASILALGNTGVLVLIYSRVKVPIPLGIRLGGWAGLSRFVSPTLALVAAVSYGLSLRLIDPHALKAAGLLLALLILAEQYSQERAGHPLLTPLLALRSDVAFGRVAPESAVRSAEVLLDGHDLEHLFQDDVAAVLAAGDIVTKLTERTRSAASELLTEGDPPTHPRGTVSLEAKLAALDRVDADRAAAAGEMVSRYAAFASKQQQVGLIMRMYGVELADPKAMEPLQAFVSAAESSVEVHSQVERARAACTTRLREMRHRGE